MCLRFVYLLVVSVFSWMRLAHRQGAWKDAEILLLRHQLAVLQREQVPRPRLKWSDRALIAALAGVIPKARRPGLPLLVTPETVVRWHRDLLRRPMGRQIPGGPLWPARNTARHPCFDPAVGRRKPGLGLPAHSRRTRRH